MREIAIRASGLVTSVGFNAPATLAAMRARLRNVYEVGIWESESGSSPPVGKVKLPQWWVGLPKFADLVAPAIHECILAADPVRAESIPVLLGVAASSRPYRLEELDTQILMEIERRLGVQLHPASGVIPSGHVSVAIALRASEEILRETAAECVIVAAVDSLVDERLKDYYLERRRLLTPGNSNGFSLGEAGGAVLVARSGSADELRILGIGQAHEAATIESEIPLKGDGLAQAIRTAMQEAGSTMDDVQYRITDLNGEHYKFKEMLLAMMRFQYQPKPRLLDLWHPNEYLGDVGAAIGPVVLANALDAGRKGYAIGPRALCTFGNDDGARACLVADYVGS
jgi:3-oxoacyl-[acyl-carrier-protein] synthase-1